MPEIRPDLSDQNRCISVHWSLPVQCVLPCTHRENWHEAWHPQTGTRIRYRRSFGIFRTGELSDGAWRDLEVPPPGEICGEPHSSTTGVFCQEPRTHNEVSWTHCALVDGCRYTWNTARPELTPDQMAQDLSRVREIAAEALADRDRAREIAVALEQQLAEIKRLAYMGGQNGEVVRSWIIGVLERANTLDPQGQQDIHVCSPQTCGAVYNQEEDGL